MNRVLEAAEAAALEAKQKHWSLIREQLRERETMEIPARPGVRSISDYPKGRFENLQRNRLRWVGTNWFEFVPKQNEPFTFVRSNKVPITPKNFFTDGGSIPRLFRWSDDLDPFARFRLTCCTTGNLIYIIVINQTKHLKMWPPS
jgi:hypothetical protein